MVLNAQILWYCLPITVFAIQNSVILQWQFQCISVGKEIVLFHWSKLNRTVKLLLILNNRKCNLAFKVRLVNYKIKLKRENFHTREIGLTYFPNSSVSLEKFPSTIPSAEAQICNYRSTKTILKHIVNKMQQTNTSNQNNIGPKRWSITLLSPTEPKGEMQQNDVKSFLP
jgi:hypothetical protein